MPFREVLSRSANRSWRSDATIMRRIVFPAALPYIVAGVRLAIGKAVVAMVIAEFFTAISGLGAIIINSANSFDTATMLVPVIILMAGATLLDAGIARLERWLAPWQQEVGWQGVRLNICRVRPRPHLAAPVARYLIVLQSKVPAQMPGRIRSAHHDCSFLQLYRDSTRQRRILAHRQDRPQRRRRWLVPW